MTSSKVKEPVEGSGYTSSSTFTEVSALSSSIVCSSTCVCVCVCVWKEGCLCGVWGVWVCVCCCQQGLIIHPLSTFVSEIWVSSFCEISLVNRAWSFLEQCAVLGCRCLSLCRPDHPLQCITTAQRPRPSPTPKPALTPQSLSQSRKLLLIQVLQFLAAVLQEQRCLPLALSQPSRHSRLAPHKLVRQDPV